MREVDVAIVGAGVAGCCVARECARFALKVAVFEAGLDVADGATRANSGIVHAGYDPKPGTRKARYNVEGAKLYPQWARELGFPYINNGSMVLAFTEDELEAVRELRERGEKNGVEGLRVIGAQELRELEPNVSSEALGALLVPAGAICDPYQVAFRAAENAARNGVEFNFSSKVVGIESAQGAAGDPLRGSAASSAQASTDDSAQAAVADPARSAAADCMQSAGFILHIEGAQGDVAEAVHARVVVNAAGVHADEIHDMVAPHAFSITPRRGEYNLMDTDMGGLFAHTMFQAPTKAGKGVLVAPTVHGNMLVGPNAVAQSDKDATATTANGLAAITSAAKKTYPALNMRARITTFAGVRATGDTGDFEIGEVPSTPGFFDIACFESPGLTSAPAVAVDMAARIAEALNAAETPHFNPVLELPALFKHMNDGARSVAIAANPDAGHMLCRCNEVTEADVASALHTKLPVLCLDALKWRTGATMGRCHGGFCMPELAKVVARESGIAPSELPKRFAGSHIVAEAPENYVELVRNESNRVAGGVADAAAKLEGENEPSEESALSNIRVDREEANGFKVEEPAPAIPSTDGLKAAAPSAGIEAGAPETGALQAPEPSIAARSSLEYDVAVIGGGAAGIAAAASAARKGASVVLVDRESHQGGILKQCIHNGFGLHRFGEELTGPEYASRELATLEGLNVCIIRDASVLRVKNGGEGARDISVEIVSPQGEQAISAGAAVLATGSRERGAGALGTPGTRPAGVFSAGSAQNFMNLQGCAPGSNVVILGSGDIGLIMARRLTFAGARVAGVFEINSTPSGLRRNIVQCLDDFGIPLHTSTTVVGIEGDSKLEAVIVSKVDDRYAPIPGTERRIPCDTLLLSVGLIPENALATDAGVALDPMTGGAIVDDNFETSAAGLFACGNALHIHDLVDFVSDEGDHAGASAARRALRRSVTPQATPPAATSRAGAAPTHAGDGVRYIVPQFVHSQTNRVTLRFRTSSSFENASIVVEKRLANGEVELVKRRRVLVAVPAEMQSVALAGEAFAGATEIMVRIEPKETGEANGGAKSGGFDGEENAPKVGGAAKAKGATESDVVAKAKGAAESVGAAQPIGATESDVAAKIAPVSAQGEEASHE